MYKQGLYRDWVPGWLRTSLLFVLVIPVLMNSGVYTSNTADMVGGLGTLGEYITLANYAVTIGMLAACPLLMPIKGALTSKTILFISLLGSIGLNSICALTTHPELIILSSFFMGLLKMITLMELIIPLMGVVSQDGNRPRFYAVFYPISIGVGQCSAWLTAYLAYEYTWQYVYYFVVITQLALLSIVVVFFHDERTAAPLPLTGIDWLSFGLFSLLLFLGTYVLAFGRLEDWFDSPRIQSASVLAGVLLLGFLVRQNGREHPFLNLSMITYKSVWGAVLFITLMSFFSASSSIQTAFTNLLRFSPQTTAAITLWTLPGILLGGLSCFLWFRRYRTYKGIVLMGFGAFVLHHGLLYFLFDAGAGVHHLWLPATLRGYGMTLLFISLGLYLTNSLPKLGMATMLSTGMFMILFRSLIGPAGFSALYSTMLYTEQVRNTTRLAQTMDDLNPEAATRYQSAYRGALAQGMNTQVAQAVATQRLLGSVQVQATLVTAKELYGGIVLVGFGVMMFTAFFHFQPLNRRKLVNWRRRLRGLQLISAG